MENIFGNETGERITVVVVAVILLICVFDMILLERCRDRTKEIFGKDKRMVGYRGLAKNSTISGRSSVNAPGSWKTYLQ